MNKAKPTSPWSQARSLRERLIEALSEQPINNRRLRLIETVKTSAETAYQELLSAISDIETIQSAEGQGRVGSAVQRATAKYYFIGLALENLFLEQMKGSKYEAMWELQRDGRIGHWSDVRETIESPAILSAISKGDLHPSYPQQMLLDMLMAGAEQSVSKPKEIG